jgi:hypothetical protein
MALSEFDQHRDNSLSELFSSTLSVLRYELPSVPRCLMSARVVDLIDQIEQLQRGLW